MHSRGWMSPGRYPGNHGIPLLSPELARLAPSCPATSGDRSHRPENPELGWAVRSHHGNREAAPAELWSPVSSMCALEQLQQRPGLGACQGQSTGTLCRDRSAQRNPSHHHRLRPRQGNAICARSCVVSE